MKKITFFILFLVFSCSEDNITSPELELPSKENAELQIDFHNSSIGIFSKPVVNSYSLKINDQNIPITDWITGESEYSGITYISSSDIPSSIEYYPGNDLSFELQINEMLFDGVIQLPYKPAIVNPQFNFDEKIYIKWDLEKNPDLQLIGFSFSDLNDMNFDSWYVEGKIREESISRDYYKDLNKDEIGFHIYVGTWNVIDEKTYIAFASNSSEVFGE